jgi:DNA-binding NarL/FixJ family response regulator
VVGVLLVVRLDREVEVLSIPGKGAGNEEIATVFGSSRNTVRKHVHGVFRTLGVQSLPSGAVDGKHH